MPLRLATWNVEYAAGAAKNAARLARILIRERRHLGPHRDPRRALAPPDPRLGRDRPAPDRAESNRIAKELLEPARERLKGLQADYAANKADRNHLLDALMALKGSGSDTAAERMASLEARGRALQSAIADEEGKLGVDETRSLSLAAIHGVLRDVDELYTHFTPGERRELLHEIIDEVRVFPDHVEVALYDGTSVEEAIQQVGRKVRGPGGGGGGKTGKGANGTPANGGTVHAVHAEVHAEAEGREPVAGSMKARAATVKLAQRVEWLPNRGGSKNVEGGGRGSDETSAEGR